MSYLFLMRHAKSDWDADYSGDHERPLNKRGIKSAKKVGKFLKNQKQQPDLIISSTSLRTKQTLKYLLETSGLTCPVTFSSDVYHASPSDIFSVIWSTPPEVDNLMILGHEPTTSSMISALIGGGNIRVPTAALACIDVANMPWESLQRGRGSLEWMVVPRSL